MRHEDLSECRSGSKNLIRLWNDNDTVGRRNEEGGWGKGSSGSRSLLFFLWKSNFVLKSPEQEPEKALSVCIVRRIALSAHAGQDIQFFADLYIHEKYTEHFYQNDELV